VKLISKESLKVHKIEMETEVINESKSPEIIEEMFSVKDIEKKINESIDLISDKVVDKILDKFMKNKDLMDKVSDSILEKINIKVEKV
jgi:hypothetical protein